MHATRIQNLHRDELKEIFIPGKRIFHLIPTTIYHVFNFLISYISFAIIDPIIKAFELLRINYFHIQNFPIRFIVGTIKIFFLITDCVFSLCIKSVLFFSQYILGDEENYIRICKTNFFISVLT